MMYGTTAEEFNYLHIESKVYPRYRGNEDSNRTCLSSLGSPMDETLLQHSYTYISANHK